MDLRLVIAGVVGLVLIFIAQRVFARIQGNFELDGWELTSEEMKVTPEAVELSLVASAVLLAVD